MGNNPSVRQFRTDMLNIVNRAKQDLHQTLLFQADELVGNMQSAAPKITGALRESIRKKDVSTADGGKLSVLVIAGGSKTTKRSGAGVIYDYSLGTEFGTVKENPEPFFYSTYRQYRQQGLTQINETFAQIIDENNRMRANRSLSFTTPSGRVSYGGSPVIKGRL